jgi:hypothetical protein
MGFLTGLFIEKPQAASRSHFHQAVTQGVERLYFGDEMTARNWLESQAGSAEHFMAALVTNPNGTVYLYRTSSTQSALEQRIDFERNMSVLPQDSGKPVFYHIRSGSVASL